MSGTASVSKYISLNKLLAIRENSYRGTGKNPKDYNAGEVEEMIRIKQGNNADKDIEQFEKDQDAYQGYLDSKEAESEEFPEIEDPKNYEFLDKFLQVEDNGPCHHRIKVIRDRFDLFLDCPVRASGFKKVLKQANVTTDDCATFFLGMRSLWHYFIWEALPSGNKVQMVKTQMAYNLYCNDHIQRAHEYLRAGRLIAYRRIDNPYSLETVADKLEPYYDDIRELIFPEGDIEPPPVDDIRKQLLSEVYTLQERLKHEPESDIMPLILELRKRIQAFSGEEVSLTRDKDTEGRSVIRLHLSKFTAKSLGVICPYDYADEFMSRFDFLPNRGSDGFGHDGRFWLWQSDDDFGLVLTTDILESEYDDIFNEVAA